MKPETAFRNAALCLPLVLVLAGAAPGPAPMSSHEKAAREVVKLIGSQDLVATAADPIMREEREDRPSATNSAAQKRTVAEIRNMGTAMFSWLTDQVETTAVGEPQTDWENRLVEFKRLPSISHEELTKVLVPIYIQKVPERDGWGEPYEYFLNVEDPMATQVMGIRSPGRDGRFSANDYTATAFDPDDLDQDIVWVDGFFVRWPQRAQPREE